MTVQEFVDGYKEIENKVYKNDEDMFNALGEFVKEHIINDYVDYERKIAICNLIIERTSYVTINSKKVYKKNTTAKYLQFIISIIKEYTDIDIDDEQILETYNVLNKNGIINLLINNISQNEYVEFNTILDMCSDDFYDNTMSIPAYLETKFDLFNITMDTLLGIAEKTITK